MAKRIMSSKNDIEESLARIGASLPQDLTAYLIGGCAMILYNAKVATKDIDLVMMSDEDADAVRAALSGAGFTVARPEDDTYRRPGTMTMMQDDRGTRFDMFVETVCRKLRITEGISNDAVCPFVSVRNRRTFLRENATVVLPHPAMGFGVCGSDPRGMSIFLRSFSPMITSEEPVSR